MNARTPDILCIGSVLWDVIGRVPADMGPGADMPGTITRLPGGVALNIAMTLARFGLRPGLLSTVGRDPEGDELVAACRGMGLGCDWLCRTADLPTDRYMAIEGAQGLVAAVADAKSLETAGARILAPLRDGSLGSRAAPWEGPIALDGNLTLDLLAEIARAPEFARADLRVAPASPGKADRLAPLLAAPNATLYVNLAEARILGAAAFADAAEAAGTLVAQGARRVLVTDGSRLAADGAPEGVLTALPPKVSVARITGAGDTFMAAHLVTERRGAGRADALAAGLAAAAAYVEGDALS